MQSDFNIMQFLPLIIPLVLVQLALIVFCLIDLSHRERTKGPKWVWALVIILGEILGPVIYLLVGRED